MSEFNDPLNDPRLPHRPDHPDFWRLSEVILRLDGLFEDAKAKNTQEVTWQEVVDSHIDSDSLIYVAMQRAMRVLGINSQAGSRLAQMDDLVRLTQCYADAFIMACEYKDRGGKQ